MGSSPLTRGKLGIGVGDVGDGGLIPAHAGKTEVQEVGGTMPGLIPAHAGKTARFRPGRAGRSAHPRSRGENRATTPRLHGESGSSPLTRGKPLDTWEETPTTGLIPAHAGKTVRSAAVFALIRAHPRSRGENEDIGADLRLLSGSSPLTRGKHARGSCASADPGLIPAHAGKTRRPALARSRRRAHPRSRGENPLSISRSGSHVGSSPLTRGKPPASQVSTGIPGLIPAHAGKTNEGA